MRAIVPAAVIVALAAWVLTDARADSAPKAPDLKPVVANALPPRIPGKPDALVPSPLMTSASGTVIVDEGSLEYLVGLALRLAARDNEADQRALLQMLAELNRMKAQLRRLLQECEAQRANGKPCEHEAELAALREELASREREVERRRRQDAAQRLAQLGSDLGRIEDELRAALAPLRGNAELKPPAGKAAANRGALTSKVQRTIDQVVARRGELARAGSKVPTNDAGAPKPPNK